MLDQPSRGSRCSASCSKQEQSRWTSCSLKSPLVMTVGTSPSGSMTPMGSCAPSGARPARPSGLPQRLQPTQGERGRINGQKSGPTAARSTPIPIQPRGDSSGESARFLNERPECASPPPRIVSRSSRKSPRQSLGGGGSHPSGTIWPSVNLRPMIRSLALGDGQPSGSGGWSAQVQRPRTNGMGFESLEGCFCSRSSVGRASEYIAGRRVDTAPVMPKVVVFKSHRELSSRSSSGPSGRGRALASARGRVVRTPPPASRTGSSTSRTTARKHQVARVSLVWKEREMSGASPSPSVCVSAEVETGEGPALRSVLNRGTQNQALNAIHTAPKAVCGGKVVAGA